MATLRRHISWKFRKSITHYQAEEIFRLKNHNKTLVTKIKKLKNNWKIEHSNENLEGKILEKQEENHRLINLNQEPEEQIKKLKYNEKLQE